MKKNIQLAALAFVVSSAANAEIMIKAGDWTVDLNGGVNGHYIQNNSSDTNVIDGGLANTKGDNGSNSSSINTGYAPASLGVTAKTRQNNLDVGFTLSFQQGASTKKALSGGDPQFRQASMTVGDKSWGSVKVGKDLGVFASDAIINDMTVLGVGSQGIVGPTGGSTTTLGRIGIGYLYPDFLGQINYTSADFKGASVTVGIVQPNGSFNQSGTSGVISGNQKSPAYEGKINYKVKTDHLEAKIWVEGKAQQVYGPLINKTAQVYAAGINVNAVGLNLTAYYFSGKGVGVTAFLMDGFDATGKERDSNGSYAQLTLELPVVETKLGLSWGANNLKLGKGETVASAGALVKQNAMTTFGLYHPLTKNVNLIAEHSVVTTKSQSDLKNTSRIYSIGSSLFF